MSQNQFKIMQAVIYITLFMIYIKWFSEFSMIMKCFIVFVITLDTTLKYITQWKTKKCIENKKEFVLDILFAIFLFFALILPLL